MKHILASVVLLVLLFPSLALGETVGYFDLVERDGIYYKKFTDIPFTGNVTGQVQYTYKNGKKHGPSISYYNNGQLWWKGDFKNGESDGPWVSYYENGQLSLKGEYKNGNREGPWVFFNQNGSKRVEPMKIGEQVFDEGSGTYKNGYKVD